MKPLLAAGTGAMLFAAYLVPPLIIAATVMVFWTLDVIINQNN